MTATGRPAPRRGAPAWLAALGWSIGSVTTGCACDVLVVWGRVAHQRELEAARHHHLAGAIVHAFGAVAVDVFFGWLFVIQTAVVGCTTVVAVFIALVALPSRIVRRPWFGGALFAAGAAIGAALGASLAWPSPPF